MDNRSSGLLAHITSLPSPYGIGDLGPDAYAFADLLAAGKQRFWQVLPLNSTDPMHANSPYSCTSAFAGNVLMISPRRLVEEGYLDAADVDAPADLSTELVDYERVTAFKYRILSRAFEWFSQRSDRSAFDAFCIEQAAWLDGYALFTAIRHHQEGKIWCDWPVELRDRKPEAIEQVRTELADEIMREKFYQFLFFRQWMDLKRHCNDIGVRIIGDIPIYVNYHSADVWTHREVFKIDENGRPTYVSGAPPDRFSSTGQLWGNPVYRWDALRTSGYAWWIDRMRHMLTLHDVVRIDHFRGFVAYWEVPAHHKTAMRGQWVSAPVHDLFNALRAQFPELPILAEDLGLITDDVRAAMNHFGLPGMKVLLFAFEEDHPHHPYLPHMYSENFVVYTGTHDNNTVRGWFEEEARPSDKKRLFSYIGRETTPDEVAWEFIRLAMMSVAKISIVPLQDVLGLGAQARMNLPSTMMGNWRWRVLKEQLSDDLAKRLAGMTRMYGRIPRER